MLKKCIKNPAKIPAQTPMSIDFFQFVFGSFFPRIFSKIGSFSPILSYKITQTVVAIVSKIVGFIIKRRLICHFSNQANFSAGIIFSRWKSTVKIDKIHKNPKKNIKNQSFFFENFILV